jgi:class 3 adenylate cyclase/predicted ATPase
MTFEEVLDQAMAMLQRRGRLTYRTLKLHFQLDDEHLEALKDELIYGQRLAVDEDGRVLVWTGGAEVPPATTLPEPQPAQPPAPQAAHAPRAAAAPAVPPSPDAERRQLTVLFCDLVDSTRLASQLDPEDWREVVRAYQQTCAEVIQRFEGHIAQYLGDGLLVYFGYPQAHEDDAQRAVRTGLGILPAMATLNRRLEPAKGVRLGVRVGIHTGLVVVGEVGGGSRQEQLALGETPNLAARLQGLAAPDTVVVSPATFRLVRGYFTAQELGAQSLKGIMARVQVYCMLGESAAQSRLDIAGPSGLTPLVGRESEVLLLLERWAHSQDGRGQVVLLIGEAGIGKSRLVEVLHERVISQGATRLVFRGSPYHQQSALYPVIEHLQGFLHWNHDEAPEAKLEALERALRTSRLPLEEVTPLFAALLSLPHPAHYPPLNLTPQRQRQKTHDALVAWLLEETEQQPILAVWEDLHWADPSTLELLGLVLDQVPTARMLTLLTCRPEFQPSWASRSHLTQMTLTRLRRPQVQAMITSLTGGKALPAAVVEQVVAKTDGVPLFVEELVKMILESSLVREEGDRYVLTGPLPPLAIPSTLHDSLMARLDRLATVKEVAQLGATIGRTFGYELLQAVSPLDEATLQQGLQQLVAAELVYQRGVPPQATYLFKHALIQEVAYQSLLRSTRQQVHQRIAQVLEARFPALVESQPELVAQHYTAAGCHEQAVIYWQRAGQHASDRSANVEAISHLTTGIELLKTLPETPEHTQQALTLYIALGAALQIAKGLAAPEVEHAYTQARAWCQQVGETSELVPVLYGLWRFYLGRSQLHTARELSETLLRLAQGAHDPALAVVAHNALGVTWLFLGALPAARQHLEAGIARYTPDQRRAPAFRMGQDPGVGCRANAARALWLLGYPDQALVHIHDALTLAYELSDPFSLAWARCWASYVYQFRRDVPAVHEQAEAAFTLATEQGFPLWAAYGTSFRGWTLAMQGQGEQGIAQVHQGIAAVRASGTALHVPYFCTVLADVAAHLGHTEDGLQALAEAHTLVEQQEERWWEAEVCRLRGVLLLRQPGTPQEEAETWLRRALDVARRQEAKSLELRAAMSLARLWQHQGKRVEAYELLAPVYSWFTEGFNTADLQEAKALLDALGE